MIETLADLGGLAGLAALITAIVGLLKNASESRRVGDKMRTTQAAAMHAAEQLSANHGSTIADAIRRIESSLNEQRDDLKQLREDAAITHRGLGTQFEAVEHRLAQLEARRLAEQRRDDDSSQQRE